MLKTVGKLKATRKYVIMLLTSVSERAVNLFVDLVRTVHVQHGMARKQTEGRKDRGSLFIS